MKDRKDEGQGGEGAREKGVLHVELCGMQRNYFF